MPELQDAGRMLEGAEQAAIAGDFKSADQLLRDALRIQEAAFGPLHPDLANTLNNLAIVAEKTGRLDDAERFYRRAVAIATTSLPPGHPMILASQENLEDFCRACGLPVGTPLGASPADDPPPPLDASRPEPIDGTDAAPIALGVLGVLAAAVLFVWQPWSREEPTRVPAAAPAEASPTPPPSTNTRPPAVVPPPDCPDVRREESPARPSSRAAVTLAEAELCEAFSASGANWRCDPAGGDVAPGRLVLYSRVRSATDGVIVHRWYRGDVLQQAVELTIRANATQGYRTYSRQSVDRGADWRVEVRTTDGALLHEQRVAVR